MFFTEALAHQFRGAAIMFFLLWSVYLYGLRKNSRMMKVMFITTVCLFLGFTKDSLFLFESIQYSDVLDKVVSILDLVTMLVACNFFCEAVKPNSTESALIWLWPLSELVFIPIYLIHSEMWVVMAAYLYCFLLLIATVVYIVFYAYRHYKYLQSHYSSHENLTVRWALVSGILYILAFTAYLLAFGIKGASWLGEALYSLFCMLIWTYIIFLAKSHKVVGIPEKEEEEPLEEAVPALEPEVAAAVSAEPEEDESSNLQYIKSMIEPKLSECMENGKLYLNPNLSLKTVATEIGSNTKYLSVYLNRCLGVSFYDYINNFRVEKACSIFREMVKSGRINMPEVSERSGFNSVSTFNRYFKKVKGLAPKDYYKRCLEER